MGKKNRDRKGSATAPSAAAVSAASNGNAADDEDEPPMPTAAPPSLPTTAAAAAAESDAPAEHFSTVDVLTMCPLACTALVGSAECGWASDRLNFPQALCQPDANTLLIADRSNGRIRSLDLRTRTFR